MGFEPMRSELLAVFKRESGSTFGGVAGADPTGYTRPVYRRRRDPRSHSEPP